MKLRDYQDDIAQRCFEKLKKYGFCYLAIEVRVGKTLIALSAAQRTGSERVLFLTKKKAISSIQNDYKKFGFDFDLVVLNYESFHKINEEKFDTLILDEAHSMGAFAKPSKRAKQVRDYIAYFQPMIVLLSGTPTPESYSQMYHQVYGIPNNPFSKHKSFYKFAKEYVDVKQKKINGMFINDYSRGKKEILEAMEPFTLTYTQQEAGFESVINENKLYVEMEENTYVFTKRLQKDLVIQGKTEVILADTAVKLMQKLHQLYSGTVKFESGNHMVLDYSKADFIRDQFKGKKIGIFYKFVAELEAIKEVFGDNVVTTVEDFDERCQGKTLQKDDHCQAIALQIVSGREGISLRNADALVYYNIDFSATSYWQSRDRMTTKDRTHNEVYWIFAKGGIEDKIYSAVTKKLDYTLQFFKKDFLKK